MSMVWDWDLRRFWKVRHGSKQGREGGKKRKMAWQGEALKLALFVWSKKS